MGNGGTAWAEGVIGGEGGADEAIGAEGGGVGEGLAGGAHSQSSGRFAGARDKPRLYAAARANPFGIDAQLDCKLFIFQRGRRKGLGIASHPEAGSLQRKGSMLLHDRPLVPLPNVTQFEAP